MLFNSIEFILFFPIVIILYFSTPHRYRWALLLLASYYFYMSWKVEYVFLIIFSTVVDYIIAIQMAKSSIQKIKKILLSVSLLSNLGLLFAFKYFNFIGNSVNEFFKHYSLSYNIPAFDILLPVGISFYTFQTLSYTIDVYRGKKEPEKHLGIFALYVSFFPQLVAGPIERATRLLPQFFEKQTFDYHRVSNGLKLMAWGFFKKLVIADRLAIFVNPVFDNPQNFEGFHFIIAILFFAIQIYCDFSGYSDIAIGASQVMGYRLMDNFNRPYFSKSIAEFWKRWHISLSTWFKDYVYIPLGGNRVVKWRWYYNLLLVFLVSGLWHGANWTFVAWGGLHGFYMIVGLTTRDIRNRFVHWIRLNRAPGLYKYIRVIITFSLVCFAWIFFRAKDLSGAFYIVRNLFDGMVNTLIQLVSLNFNYFKKLIAKTKMSEIDFIVAVVSILFLEFIHSIQRHGSIRQMLSERPLIVRWLIYYILIFSIFLLGVFEKVDFIYFQF